MINIFKTLNIFQTISTEHRFTHFISEYQPLEFPALPETAAEFDENGPRLVIYKIVNENFKSYAGVQALGPFHKVRLPFYLMAFAKLIFLSKK